MGEDKNNPFSVRMDPADKAKLLKLIEESDTGSNKDFMNVLMSAYTLNKVKVEIPEASEDIRKVEELTQLINDYFVNMSKQIKTSKELLNLQFTKDLDVYKRRVDSLSNENSKNEVELDLLRTSYNSTCSENSDFEKQIEQFRDSLQDKTSLVEEYKSKNDMLLGDLTEHKQFKVQLEEYKKLLADSQARNIDKDNIIKDNEYTVTQLTKSNEKLIQDNQREIKLINKDNEKLIQETQTQVEKQKKENQNGIDQLNKESSLNIKIAVAEIKEELNNKLFSTQAMHNEVLEKNQTKYNAEILQYQIKYKELLHELESFKKQSINQDEIYNDMLKEGLFNKSIKDE